LKEQKDFECFLLCALLFFQRTDVDVQIDFV